MKANTLSKSSEKSLNEWSFFGIWMKHANCTKLFCTILNEIFNLSHVERRFYGGILSLYPMRMGYHSLARKLSHLIPPILKDSNSLLIVRKNTINFYEFTCFVLPSAKKISCLRFPISGKRYSSASLTATTVKCQWSFVPRGAVKKMWRFINFPSSSLAGSLCLYVAMKPINGIPWVNQWFACSSRLFEIKGRIAWSHLRHKASRVIELWGWSSS